MVTPKATAHIARPSKSRTRTKTFTGCWTCRSRKVRCDEGRPACVQCSSKNIPCDGYDTRLLWMPVGTGKRTVAPEKVSFQSRSRRRLIETFNQPVEIAEIDSAYEQIDSLAERAASSPSTLTAGLFGVFSCLVSRSAPAKDAFVDPSECSNLSSQQQYSGYEALATPFSDPLSAVQEDADYTIDDLQSPMGSTPRMCLQSESLPRTHRYLLHHYANRVADIFCIIENPNSPWHTIHIPKAMQTAGELSITGRTSRIRHALLTAILATSAFILAHDQNENSSGPDDWETIAIGLRHRAICLLKQAVDEEFYSTQKPKYKDFLVSMLTMVTIDVMSGDTGSCSVHLYGCEQLIRVSRKTKVTYSSKARALHRMFFYLRTIHGSTLCRPENEQQAGVFQNSPSPNSASEESPDSAGAGYEFYPPEWLDISQKTEHDRNTLESIYGLPESLVSLLHRAVGIITALERERRQGLDSTSVPSSLSGICDNLENQILDWPRNIEIERCSLACTDTRSAEIMKHQICSWHNALIIYFAQNVRNMPSRYLRHNVESVLESENAIQTIKTTSKMLAGPSFWPAFIAASMAVDSRLQADFAVLFAKFESYGFHAAARSGHDIIFDVWRRLQEGDERCSWRRIVQEKSMTLMLS